MWCGQNSAGERGCREASSWCCTGSILLCWQCRQVLVHVPSKAAPDIPRWNKALGSKPPWVWDIVQVEKNILLKYFGTTGWKTPLETSLTWRYLPPCLKAMVRDVGYSGYTAYWGIVPQHSVYVALSTYQKCQMFFWGEDTDGQHDTFSSPS